MNESLVIYHLTFVIYHFFRKPEVFKWRIQLEVQL